LSGNNWVDWIPVLLICMGGLYYLFSYVYLISMNMKYRDQVSLLLNVLPEVGKEKTFALHGGTAINLFIRDMPRLSVDIDLTYLPIEDRETTIDNIAQALTRIKENIEKKIPGLSATLKKDIGKLLITT